MNDFLKGEGYMELGMPEEAQDAFLNVGPEDPAHATARARLLLFASHLDRVAQNQKAEEGLALIRSRPEIVNSTLVTNTSLCLHFAGRSREAYDLTHDFANLLDWTPMDFYGLASYASRFGDYEQASEDLVEGMAKRLSPDYSHLLVDPDFLPLFRHAAEGTMKMATAISFANPRLGNAIDMFLQQEPECDVMLFREMPTRFQSQVRKNLITGMYEMPSMAPAALRREYRAWLKGIESRNAALARRGIARAQAMVLDTQFNYAVAAANRGDVFAARHHAITSMAARPDSFGRFDKALSPLGMAWFFDDIRKAWTEDPSFRQLMTSCKPLETIPPESQLEILEACGSLAKKTTFWIVCRSIVARSVDERNDAKSWHVEVIRRWPADPVAYHNLLLMLETEEAWDAASLLLANVPQSFHCLCAAEAHRLRINAREAAAFPKYTAFYGQPDIGGVVILPGSTPGDAASPHETGQSPHPQKS